MFSQFDVFINVFTSSPLNGVSSRFFLNFINKKKCLMPSNHIQTNTVEWNIFMATEHELKDKIERHRYLANVSHHFSVTLGLNQP